MADSGERLRSLYHGDVAAVFSSKVADYRAARPDYPAAVFDALLSAPAVVADLGSGTGLFTRGLLARGHEVHAVEPSAEMRRAAQAELAHVPRFHSVAGSAEATTLPDGSVDCVTAAQAFHWFHIERTRAESLRILRPRGTVALVWNERRAADPLQAALDEVFAEFGGEKRAALLAHEARGNEAPAFFNGAPVQALHFDCVQQLDAAGLESLVFSRSFMPARETADGMQAAARVQALFQRFVSGATVTLRYRTAVLVGRPLP